MAKPGDIVELRPGTLGLQPPNNVAILLSRDRRKGVPWVELWTIQGRKECKQEHLLRRSFRVRYEGDVANDALLRERLRTLVTQHGAGGLPEEAEDDLSGLEERMWEIATSQAGGGAESFPEAELARLVYGEPSAAQMKGVREALERCRRPGTGRFQTAGRGDRWRPWTRPERGAMEMAWRSLETVRKKLVRREPTADGPAFIAASWEEAQFDADDRAALAWMKAAMVQMVEWDGPPGDGSPIAGIGGLPVLQAFGMDLPRALGFLAEDWIGTPSTSRASDFVHFLLRSGLWTPDDAVASLTRRHVNQEQFFEHVPDHAAEEAAATFGEPTLQPGRTDLRHLTCYTIDPPDAKDFDDAVGFEAVEMGATRLWVHVADVSAYVTPDSLLDRHAKKRATSVYLPGRVLPMLPHRLSDHLCSLRSDGDRFALSVSLDIDADGRSSRPQFFRSLIRVTENLSYGVALERARAGDDRFANLLTLADRMRRHRRGIALETGELKVLVGASGFSALEKHADDATRMIETFMVAANEAVAEHLTSAGVPCLFRCHPLPEPAKAQRLAHQLATMGIEAALDLPRKPPTRGAAPELLIDRLAKGGKLNLFGGGVNLDGGGEPEPSAPEPLPGFASVSADEQEAWLRPFRTLVERLSAIDDGLAEVATLKLLGCMGRAFYSPDNVGHFGLGLVHYAHFTSPIRRYPDLVVHRNLAWLIAGKPGPVPHSQESLRSLCDHCSNQERSADGLERRVKAACLVLAASDGATGPARITGVTPANLFILRDDGLEARIPLREIPGGPFDVDEWESQASERETASWKDAGAERNVRFKLGQRVSAKLVERDVAAGRTSARLS